MQCIDNLNFNGSINIEEIFNLFKTKSSSINYILLSKIDCHTKLLDFFNKHTSLDIKSISKSIDNINSQFLNIIVPKSIKENENLESYISILSTIILIIHFSLKIKTIICKKVKEIQQGLIESILNNKFEDAYKDKIIEYNSLSNAALNSPLHGETTFSTFLINKPKISNHFNSTCPRQFSKEDPTPKFCVMDKEPKKKKYHRSSKIIETKRENEDNDISNEKNISTKKSHKSSKSLISMSSILVMNNCAENNAQKNQENPKRKSKRIKHNTISEKKNYKHKLGDVMVKKPILSDKFLENNITRRKTSKTVIVKSINNNNNNNNANNNNGNKEIFVEFLKFANEIYKENHINEKQKKSLKQLIINYIAEKNQRK